MMLSHLHRLTLALTLIAGSVLAQTSNLVTVQDNGSRSKRVNLVYLSEGYASSEMSTYATDVQTALYVPPDRTAIPMELSAGTNSPPRNTQLTFQQLRGDDPPLYQSRCDPGPQTRLRRQSERPQPPGYHHQYHLD